MLIKDNVTIGIEWRFGPDWPGQRCSAKTRRATRVSVQPTRRMAGAASMAGPALVQRPKRVERGSRRRTFAIGSSPRTSLRSGVRTRPRDGRSVRSFARWNASWSQVGCSTRTGETVSRHRCHSRHPMMDSLHRLQHRKTLNLILPVTPMTPVTTKGPACVSCVIGSSDSCATYDTCCNRSSSSSAHLIEVRRFAFTNSSLASSRDVKR